jgi:hypothetical protein
MGTWRAVIMLPQSVRIRAETAEQAKTVALDIIGKHDNVDGYKPRLMQIEGEDQHKGWIPDDLPPPPLVA